MVHAESLPIMVLLSFQSFCLVLSVRFSVFGQTEELVFILPEDCAWTLHGLTRYVDRLRTVTWKAIGRDLNVGASTRLYNSWVDHNVPCCKLTNKPFDYQEYQMANKSNRYISKHAREKEKSR